MTDYYKHLAPTDYPVRFPAAADAMPVVVQKRTWIDDWLLNRMYSMMQSVQAYLITNKASIEA